MNSKEMRKVANRIRKRLEKIATTLYPGTGPHLGGLCGYGSLMLHKELTELGRAPQVVSGSGHWFIVCDGLLVDVTASQFGQAKVVVRSYEKIQQENDGNHYSRYWWNTISIGTPQKADIAGYQESIDRAMKAYKSRKHTKANVAASPPVTDSVVTFSVGCPAPTAPAYTFIDLSRKE